MYFLGNEAHCFCKKIYKIIIYKKNTKRVKKSLQKRRKSDKNNNIPNGGVAQLVRASACHAEGRGFEPLHSRHYKPLFFQRLFILFFC